MEPNQTKISEAADKIMGEFLTRSKNILKTSGIKPTDGNIQFVFDRLYVLEGSMLGMINKTQKQDDDDDLVIED